MIIERYLQGSPEWHAGRLGRVTMSHAKDLITKGRGNSPSVTRENYILDVAAEQLSGKPTEQVKTWDMDRGILLEPFALRAYQQQTGRSVENIGLAYLDDTRTISASPDGLCGSFGDGGVEIKCPRPRTHMRYINEGSKRNAAQIQGNMWVFGAAWWDFVSFCPEFDAHPLHVERVERDDEMIAKISRKARLAVYQVKAIVGPMRRSQTTSEVLDICSEAIRATDNFFSDGEVAIDE